MLGLGFSSTSDVRGIEYLLTEASSPETDLNNTVFNYTNGNVPPSALNLLLRVHFTTTDVAAFQADSLNIYTGNFVLDIDDPTVASITNVVIQVPPNWNIGTLVPPGGTGSSTYTGTFASSNGWQPTEDGNGYYLTLATFDLTSFNQSYTDPVTANVNVAFDGNTWMTDGATGTYFAPTASGFAVTVPEPSTYISAAMACAALSGVALKKRKANKAVATA